MIFTWLLRREVLLTLLTLLCLTAPLSPSHNSWSAAYSACVLILSAAISWSAHSVFRAYQLLQQPTPQHSVVTTLMVLLSICLQAAELHFTSILLLRLLWQEGSLLLYQTQPLVFCILLSPRWGLDQCPYI